MIVFIFAHGTRQDAPGRFGGSALRLMVLGALVGALAALLDPFPRRMRRQLDAMQEAVDGMRYTPAGAAVNAKPDRGGDSSPRSSQS